MDALEGISKIQEGEGADLATICSGKELVADLE